MAESYSTLNHFLRELWDDGVTSHDELVQACMHSSVPRELYYGAVCREVSSFIGTKTKAAERRLSSAVKTAKAAHRRKVDGKPPTQQQALAVTQALLDSYRDMLPAKFYCPTKKAMVSWADATVVDHEDHIAFREATVSEHQQVIARHRKAADFLKAHHYRSLGSITDVDVIIKLAFTLP